LFKAAVLLRTGEGRRWPGRNDLVFRQTKKKVVGITLKVFFFLAVWNLRQIVCDMKTSFDIEDDAIRTLALGDGSPEILSTLYPHHPLRHVWIFFLITCSSRNSSFLFRHAE
jgi:hypothetical protein